MTNCTRRDRSLIPGSHEAAEQHGSSRPPAPMSPNSCQGQLSAEPVFCKAGLVGVICANKGGQMNESEFVVVGIDVA